MQGATSSRLSWLACTVAVASLLSVAWPTPAHADGPACKIAVKGDSPVAAACKAGGIPKAKAKMRELTKAAKRKGVKLDCDSCHKDDVEWTLTPTARKDFQKLLDASAAKPAK